MTDTAVNLQIPSKHSDGLQSFPVLAAAHIYKGQLCMVTAAGYLDDAVATANSFFAGVAADECDNSAGASAALSCNCYRKGRFLLTFSDSLTVANIGDKVWATDNQVCTITSATNKQKVGNIVGIHSTSQAWVDIDSGTGSPELGA